MSNYRQDLIARFWQYQQEHFPDWERYFERPIRPNGRPPVFREDVAAHNVLIEPDMPETKQKQLLHEIPVSERHRWFRSMTSSQALAQSILGNLKVYDRLHFVSELTDDFGYPLLGDANVSPENFSMEYSVKYLGEPRSTSVDGFITGDYQVAIECKFAETEVGSCSRPRLEKGDSNYETDCCDGTFTRQRGRRERCSLTEVGVLYWKYVPGLFTWQNDRDLSPCPLRRNYQLVRNILAACIRPNGTLLPQNGHAVLIYDERNPAFQRGGDGFDAFEETREALKNPNLLRKCSWQRIIRHIRNKADLTWLTEQLESKYGL